ncbi:hypothetical protein [Roseovarius sp. E0-M6]|uniref:hypothetical protein n=1 Tax=Roseovarius sp. E0-M6 TaxID=3127118 RepID=UPI0030104BED
MMSYSPEKMLISVHVPKCAGTSFGNWLAGAFGDRLHLHYPNSGPPEPVTTANVHCVHGHFFHHQWDISAACYYPQAKQFITVLRDPVQMMISSYFYQCKMGDAPFATLDRYIEHVLTWPRLFPYIGLPLTYDARLDRDQVEAKFVWLGCVERLPQSLDNLAVALNLTSVGSMPRKNGAPRLGVMSDLTPWQSSFREKFRWEYELYDLAESMNAESARKCN